MTDRVLGNYLRTHRKRSALSQQEIGRLIGYKNQWQVSRHERSRTAPPLFVALAYEAIFRVPAATLFTEMYATVTHVVEGNLAALEKDLRSRKSGGHLPMAHTQKLKWLSNRKASK
ncbi:MAG: helix-turn-helix transcriptional regulator [Bryobacteraceae bacterium]